jgi:hypothetical protein
MCQGMTVLDIAVINGAAGSPVQFPPCSFDQSKGCNWQKLRISQRKGFHILTPSKISSVDCRGDSAPNEQFPFYPAEGSKGLETGEILNSGLRRSRTRIT